MRLRTSRLKVWRKGTLLAETAEVVARLRLSGRPDGVVFSLAVC
jgi:cytosine deaminase